MNPQFVGLFLLVMGILFLLHDKVPFVGHLPGDLIWHGKHGALFLPLGSSLLVSLVLLILLGLLGRR